jgi:hypothetical protein
MQAFLKKHGPGHSGHSLKVNWQRDGMKVFIDFQVTKRSSRPWQTKEVFTPDWSKNWGLWDKDVVESFLQLRENDQDLNAPYLEIQVSPLNQPFALIVSEPRKIFFPPKILDFKTTSVVDGKSWKASLEVALPSELKGDKLYGGFFSCLDHGPREFYALEPNPEEIPDFHRPDLFLPLDY